MNKLYRAVMDALTPTTRVIDLKIVEYEDYTRVTALVKKDGKTYWSMNKFEPGTSVVKISKQILSQVNAVEDK